MDAPGFTVFDTPIGACALVWGEAGLKRVLLPERDGTALRARLLKSSPDAVEIAPPPAIAAAIEAIGELLSGSPRDLGHIAIDFGGASAFEVKVYRAIQAIPPGALVTYGELAARLGDPGAGRAVGVALGRNPVPIVAPCHRVVAAGGRLGGFTAPGGLETKRRLLAIEGARLGDEPDLFAPG